MRPLPHRRRALSRLAKSILSIPIVALAIGNHDAHAQTARPDFYVANGTVNAAVVSGNTLYVGGEFTHVGPSTGSGVPTDAVTGFPVTGFPAVGGCVYSAIGDGAGGWYVGGSFTSIGGVPRLNLAHVLSDLSVAPWDPQPNTTVLALARSGSAVYLGGFFTQVGGQNRALIAAVDATSGALAAFDAGAVPVGFNSVRAISIQGSTLYVAGNFDAMGGKSRRSLAALDASSGQATSWDPNLQGGIPDVVVLGLAASATTIYVCGNFFAVGSDERSYIGAIDVTTGQAAAWDAQSDDEPLALALQGDMLYVGGQFTHIGGADRQYIAALDATSGNALDWNPGADNWLSCVVVDGSTVYAGGSFTAIGGASRSHVGAVDATTGLATSWNPDADDWVGTVLPGGGTVYVGGIYRSLGGAKRSNLAALDLTTGLATTWNPGADAAVQALAVDGSTVYAGGWFSNAGGQPRAYLAALDATNGQATGWNPGADGAIQALVTDGTVVYAGGSFAHAGGLARNNLAAIEPGSGLATTWDPSADGPVHALAIHGATIYAGGSFTQIGGQPRNRIAALDATTAGADSWDPDADSDVLALALDGTNVYTGGRFSGIGGQPRSNLAAIDMGSGEATGWNPDSDGGVLALAVSGTTVYAGGEFTHVGEQDRAVLAALDVGGGTAAPWDPAPGTIACPNGSDAVVNALAVSGVTVYAGGAFTSMARLPRGYLAAIGDVTTPVQVSLVSAEAEPGHVRLVWYAADGFAFHGTVYRRSVGDWEALGQVSADGTGRILFDDRLVSAGARYDYRLGVVEAGVESFFGETWVDVPAEPELTLAGAFPNPSGRNLSVAFSLPDASPARIELMDVAGRRLLAREVGTLGPGRHVLDLSQGRPLAPGAYVVRLTSRRRALTKRVVVRG